MMTERECKDELVAKGWFEQPWRLKYDSWMIEPGARWGLWFCHFPVIVGEDSLSGLLSATMPGSAGITVATYFGLRNPGGG